MGQSDGDFYHRSDIAGQYAACRPRYPRALFEYLAAIAPSRSSVWDCGTGNGQAAELLAEFFAKVVATDHSFEQIRHARRSLNVDYRVAEAEQSGLESTTVDLVTVAHAVHWFELDRFYSEVRRVLNPGGVIAVWCYRWPRVENNIDRMVVDLWHCVPRAGPVQLVENGYTTLPFPFAQEVPPAFTMNARWGYRRFADYLGTWKWLAEAAPESAQASEINRLFRRLEAAWGDVERDVHWELFIRVGKNDTIYPEVTRLLP